MDKRNPDNIDPITEIGRNFQITKVTYKCGAPDCPGDHEGTPQEFLAHAAFLVLLLGIMPSETDALVIGMISEQEKARGEGYPFA